MVDNIRAFISIDLPEEVKKEIKKIQAALPEFKGKKTEFENLHLTLKFLGEIDEARIDEIKKKLGEINFGSFSAGIDELGVFSEKFIRIVWVHLSGCDDLQKEVDEKLKDLFEKERRFMSHITIARVKHVKDKRKFIEDVGRIKIKNIGFKVDRFYLKKSVLKPEGPEYSVIEEYSADK